jgi:hypothetical protein
MKKVILFGIVAIMIASLLLASGPPLRIVRLTVINKSGNDVFLKLEGSDLGNQFYYLTIPAGTKSMPVVRAFTIIEDVYTRTTTYGEGKYDQCVGVSSSGQLIAHKNIRLTFVPCAYGPPTRVHNQWVYEATEDSTLGNPGDVIDEATWASVNASDPQEAATWKKTEITVKAWNNGEPSQEKVLYAKYLNLRYGSVYDEDWEDTTFDTSDFERLNVLWKRGCGFDTYLYWSYSYTRVPYRGLCRWTYLYDSTHEY